MITAITALSEPDRIAALALAEDGEQDLTTDVTVPAGLPGEGVIELRTGGGVAGTRFGDAIARQCGCSIAWRLKDGDCAPPGTDIGVVTGALAAILRVERPLLNVLQRACGIATMTRGFVDAVAGTRCRILHTRKTAPGLRALDIEAVLAGGGGRHRTDLAHQVMVKDNHWQALRRHRRSLADALTAARAGGISALYVEVESLEELEEACGAGATRLLIDNQPAQTLQIWARLARQRSPTIEIEATGGITLENVRAYAEAGADFVSIGSLTHSARAADVALEVRF